MIWQPNALDNSLLQLALEEDLGLPWQDATTEVLFDKPFVMCRAEIISKHDTPVVICGIPWIKKILATLSNNFNIESEYSDGQVIAPGNVLLRLEADAHTLLSAERTLLNFLRHLSAIASLTKKYVDKVQHTSLKILDTRKTTPGLRHLEKYAVACGGGVNHRMGLYDAIMVKDTHVDLLGGMERVLVRLSTQPHATLPIIIEVRTKEELQIVLELGQKRVSRVLLDNMSPDLLRECVALCRGVFETEASGNIRLNTIVAVAETGVEYASVGELTYGASQVDLSMRTFL